MRVVVDASAKTATVALEGVKNVTLTLRDVSWARARYDAPRPVG
ncbi:hypothetical protein [Acidithiobacillus sp.]|nr:hypothetical protein [Acidithiobacillus sp.]